MHTSPYAGRNHLGDILRGKATVRELSVSLARIAIQVLPQRQIGQHPRAATAWEMELKEKLRAFIEKSGLPDVICGKYVEGRGIDLFNEVCRRNLEGVVAKRKTGTYATVSGWLKIKNPHYTKSERRHELFDSFKVKQKTLPPIPKKPPVRNRPPSASAKAKASSK